MSALPNEPNARPADWEAFYRDYRKPGYVPGFEITTKLGGGMFGLVFRARRMSIGKDYAIKFLQVDDGDVRKAVLGELEQVKYFAQIDHPNLVSIEDRGEVDGIPYLVMAFAGTETLRDKIVQQQVPAGEAKDDLVRWFLQACRGLAALHERSLVHFDVKPANVFLKGGVARLGDYGLSKLVTHSRGSLSMGRGTPYYMAPEMLQRRGDHRSDVYSAGIVLYEILCAEMPFTGDSEWEVLRKHETQAPVLPDHLTPRERAVLQRCLQKDPAARYQSVHDLIAAFGVPTSAGAAVWTDVASAGASGANATAANMTPPPLPGERPAQQPKASSDEDPYAGLGRASREAFRHANTIAHKAYQEASRVTRDATEKARKLVRETMEKSRHGGLRRAAALKRLRRMHTSDERDDILAVAGSIAGGPRKHRRWGGWVAAALVFFALFVVPVMFMAGAPMPATVAYTTSADPPQPSAPMPVSFRAPVIPPAWLHLVSVTEPSWVGLATVDRTAARRAMLEHIERLRGSAPLLPSQRAARPELPHFEPNVVDQQAARQIRAQLDQLVTGRAYDGNVARKLAQQAPLSLTLAAQRLTEIRWQDAGERARAGRLQKLLVDTTDCKDMPVIDDGDLQPQQLAALNEDLGALWLWFLNEFAHTKRTWTTYRSLLKDR